MTGPEPGPYRAGEDRLGLDEREGEAVRMLGRWREAVRTRVLLCAAVIGVGAAGVGFYLGVELQLEASEYASARIAAVMAAGFFIATLLGGRQLANVVIARRTPRMLDQLAEDYEVPRARLSEMADLLRRL